MAAAGELAFEDRAVDQLAQRVELEIELIALAKPFLQPLIELLREQGFTRGCCCSATLPT
jgi:hypothetical protein